MAELRKITIPDLIKVNALVEDEKGNQKREVQDYTFYDYVGYLINTQEGFNKTGPGIRAGVRIMKKLSEAKESEDMVKSIVIDEPDWTLLQETSEEPPQGYPFGPTRLLLSFLDAINDAEKV